MLSASRRDNADHLHGWEILGEPGDVVPGLRGGASLHVHDISISSAAPTPPLRVTPCQSIYSTLKTAGDSYFHLQQV